MTIKVLAKVNNYQYGMAQFKTFRERYAYNDVLVSPKLHHVYLEIEIASLDWLKRLLNNRIEIIEIL